MTKIYLIRHAEAEGNLYRIAQGQYNSLITSRGYRQISALEKRFEGIHIDAVYSSDLYRTCVTAGAIYLPKHLPLRKRKDLREICVGEWEQKTWGEIALRDAQSMSDFSAHLDRWHIPGAETPEQVRDRLLYALREIAEKNDGKTVAVFSHGCAIRIVLATLQGYSIAELGQTPLGTNTAVSLLEGDAQSLKVVFRDDDSHLTGASMKKRPGAGLSPLNPGLRFEPLELPKQADWLRACVADAWAASADSRPLDHALLLKEAEERPTLVAIMNGHPAGLLQLNIEKDAARDWGWISLYCMDQDFRAKGYGVQLLGQAVQAYRPLGRKELRLALAEGNAQTQKFFTDYGFTPAGEKTRDGREIFRKDISFHDLPGKVIID